TPGPRAGTLDPGPDSTSAAALERTPSPGLTQDPRSGFAESGAGDQSVAKPAGTALAGRFDAAAKQADAGTPPTGAEPIAAGRVRGNGEQSPPSVPGRSGRLHLVSGGTDGVTAHRDRPPGPITTRHDGSRPTESHGLGPDKGGPGRRAVG